MTGLTVWHRLEEMILKSRSLPTDEYVQYLLSTPYDPRLDLAAMVLIRANIDRYDGANVLKNHATEIYERYGWAVKEIEQLSNPRYVKNDDEQAEARVD